MYFFYEVVLHYKTFSREVYSESSLNTDSLFSWNKYNVILTEKCGGLLRNRFRVVTKRSSLQSLS